MASLAKPLGQVEKREELLNALPSDSQTDLSNAASPQRLSPTPFLSAPDTSSTLGSSVDDDPDSCATPCKHHFQRDRQREVPHAPDLDRFVKSLTKSLKRVYPRPPGSYHLYERAHIVLLRWEEDDLHLQAEIDQLLDIFNDLHVTEDKEKFTIDATFRIPSERFKQEMEKRVAVWKNDFAEKQTDLLVIYYGGHARIDDHHRCIWFPRLHPLMNQDGRKLELNWTTLQNSFRDAEGHVVFILDACHALAAAQSTSAEWQPWEGTKELVVACGKFEKAEASHDKSFTSELLNQLKQAREDGGSITIKQIVDKIKAADYGRRNSPDIIELGNNPRSLSWHLRFRSAGDDVPTARQIPPGLADGDTRVLLSIRLHSPVDPRSIPDWDFWLKMYAPADIADIDVSWTDSYTKYARVEGAFSHGSTLLLLSVPLQVWKELPKEPEYGFIDYIRSENLLKTSTQDSRLSSATPAAVSKVENWLDQDDNFSDTASTVLTSVFSEDRDRAVRDSAMKVVENLPPLPASFEAGRTEHPGLLRGAINLPEFEHTKLPSLGTYIRLVRLLPGVPDSPQIDCELFEARYLNYPAGWHVHEGEGTFRAPKGVVHFDALSWHEDSEDNHQFAVMIRRNGLLRKQRVSRNLALALKYLRATDEDRILWVDAMCVDLKDVEERNIATALRSKIFRDATRARIWLGEERAEDYRALGFLQSLTSRLLNLEKALSDLQYAQNFYAVFILMQRPYFSRTMSIHDISVATKAIIHSGKGVLPWPDFVLAVGLFIDVENKTHRVSELARRADLSLQHNPFEKISESPAGLLLAKLNWITTRSRLAQSRTRTSEKWPLQVPTINSESVTLNSLVSSSSLFGVDQPRDAVYLLLALASDTFPNAVTNRSPEDRLELSFVRHRKPSFISKPFPVDYSQPYVDFCQSFIKLSISTSSEISHPYAFDVLCQPWARRSANVTSELDDKPGAYPSDPNVRRSSTDVAISRKWGRLASAIKTWQDQSLPSWVASVEQAPYRLESQHQGAPTERLVRRNADPLVPIDGRTEQIYTASIAFNQEWMAPFFRKRVMLGHLSLFVKGFVIDKVDSVEQPATDGRLPNTWLRFGGWLGSDDRQSTAFWRTLVGDRREDGQHIPSSKSYAEAYAEACQDAIQRGYRNSRTDVYIDIPSLAAEGSEERVAQFCRRVQAVIWNRALAKTRDGTLMLVPPGVRKGDLVCIVHGCSVPVIMRQGPWKTRNDLSEEKFDDRLDVFKRVFHRCLLRRHRKETQHGWDSLLKVLKLLPESQDRGHIKQKGGSRQDTHEGKRISGKANTSRNGQLSHLTDSRKGAGDGHSDSGSDPYVTAGSDDDLYSETEERLSDQADASKDSQTSGASHMGELGADSGDETTQQGMMSLSAAELKARDARLRAEDAAKEMAIQNAWRRLHERKLKAKARDKYRHYQLLGGAYVHGMMDGQATQVKATRHRVDHVFEIR